MPGRTQNPDSWFYKARLAAGFPNAALLAQRLKVPKVTVYQWERGSVAASPTYRPPWRLMPLLAETLAVPLPEVVEALWKETVGDPCPCGCGGTKVFPEERPEARTLAIEIPCAKCRTKRIHKRWKTNRHRKFCPTCASTAERKEFACGGYRDHDATRYTETCERSIWLRPGDINARERLKERFPDSRFNASSQTYQCNRCASTERLLKAQEERLREIDSQESGRKKSENKTWAREDRLRLFQNHRHRLYGGKLRTGFTPEERERGRRKHAENAAEGVRYPNKIQSNLKRRWIADFLPKRLNVATCVVCKKFQLSEQSE